MSMVHSIGRCCSVYGAQQGGVVVSMVQQGGVVVSMVHSIGRCCSVCGAQQGGVVVSRDVG